MLGALTGRRLLFTTKEAALYLQITERMIRRGREEDWLHPVACTVKKPHGFLWDPIQLDAEYASRKTRHAA